MSLLPAKYTLNAWEGSTFRKTISVLTGGPGSATQNLTGYTGLMNLRSAPGETPYFTLSTSSGGITIEGGAGALVLFISAVDTATLQTGVYDLSITAGASPADTVPLLWGTFRVQGVAVA